MDLLQQCQLWHEEDQFQNIVDAIEAIPEAERTPLMISELARAYNNIATSETLHLYKKAIKLLLSVEDEFAQDHNWNFRMGYAYYYLDQEGRALPYFEHALAARPNDEDTLQMIKSCHDFLTFPRFLSTFAKRTKECWTRFEQAEASIRETMSQCRDSETMEKAMERCNEVLLIALSSASFELGWNGTKYELILSSEGDLARLYALIYMQKHVPQAILTNWNILVGRQPSIEIALRAKDHTISGDEVTAWIHQGEGEEFHKRVSIHVYSPILARMLKEEPQNAWWIVSLLFDHMLGEITAMKFIDGCDILQEPEEEAGIPLSQLREELSKRKLDVSNDPDAFVANRYTAYQWKPVESEDFELRFDVYAGVTRCPELINEYYQGESDCMDRFHEDGAVPGFFFYPLDCFAKEEKFSEAVLDFRESMEEALLQAVGSDAITFIGGASGHTFSYLDFIAWDLPAVLTAAQKIFEDTKLSWASFHTLRRGVEGMNLMDHSEKVDSNQMN